LYCIACLTSLLGDARSSEIDWPVKDCDYDSDNDYGNLKENDGLKDQEPSQEKFKKGQYVAAMFKNDKNGYAMFQVKAVDVSVTALIRVKGGKGKLKSYPRGMFNLVQYCRAMTQVCMLSVFCNTRFKIGFFI
jgi:hypothetical protein